MPFRSELELGALRQAPGNARLHAVNVLRDWGLRHLEESAALVISELMTNSVLATERAAGGAAWLPPIRLWLRGDPFGVYVLVGDTMLTAPEPRQADELDESGRGLAVIVAQLSAEWGWYATAGGKVTWALVREQVTGEE
jgi:hypothetical protein